MAQAVQQVQGPVAMDVDRDGALPAAAQSQAPQLAQGAQGGARVDRFG